MTETSSTGENESKFEFWCRKSDHQLARRLHDGTGGVQYLVDTKWVTSRKWVVRLRGWLKTNRSLTEERWEMLSPEAVEAYFRGNLFPGEPNSEEGCNLREWILRTPPGRYLKPPLPEGGSRRVSRECMDQAREQTTMAIREKLSLESVDKPLDVAKELEEQLEAGYTSARDRETAAEQRAGYYLTATALTTTLVLANAGIFSDSKLGDSWTKGILGALLVASLFAIFSGLRALQASMTTFDRAYSDFPRIVENRMGPDQLSMVVQRCAALLLATIRAGHVGEWKFRRLRGARKLFTVTVIGVVLATGCLVIGNFQHDGDDDTPPKTKSGQTHDNDPETG